MKLIIAEKPSLGRNIASALGVTKKGNGYLESDKYIISWAFGHIFPLKDVDDYLGKKTAWKDAPLPFIPKPFEYKENKDAKEQISTLKKLIQRKDVTEIVNAGDADREGQIIIDTILHQLKNKKPVSRLWLPEQTESTIQKQIQALEDNNKYHNLAQEGYARTYMDWIFGINLTRYVSLKANKMLPVGRVLIPIVKQIYDRDLEIRNFIKKKYYILESRTEKDSVEIPLSLKNEKYNHNKLNEAESSANKLNKNKAIVSSIEKKNITKQASKLFSLSKLQSYLSKKHKIEFSKSIELIQKLYEGGYITYPRTNTEYLAVNEKGKVKDIIASLSEYPLEFKDSKKIFDDSKIESHSAIIPTTKKYTPSKSLESLAYIAVQNRFISNFLKEETITEKVTMTISVGNKEFKLNGESIKEEGFYKYEPEKFENQLPQLFKGDEFSVDFKPIEKETSPPKKVSEEDLANYLKNPFKKDNDSEDEEYLAMLQGLEIGTEATRTGIVESAKKYNYISQESSNYSITELGERLIEILDKLEINLYKEKSVEFSKLQKQIYKGEKQLEEVVDFATREIENIINKEIEIEKFESERKESSKKEPIGKCLICGGDITESSKVFSCNKCDVKIFKESNFFGKKLEITSEKMKGLLNKKEVMINVTDPEGKKTKQEFELLVNGKFLNFKQIKKEGIVGKCLACGGDIIENSKIFGCKKCSVKVFKESTFFGKKLEITSEKMKELLKEKEVMIDVTDLEGKKIKKEFKLQVNGIYLNFKEVRK